MAKVDPRFVIKTKPRQGFFQHEPRLARARTVPEDSAVLWCQKSLGKAFQHEPRLELTSGGLIDYHATIIDFHVGTSFMYKN